MAKPGASRSSTASRVILGVGLLGVLVGGGWWVRSRKLDSTAASTIRQSAPTAPARAAAPASSASAARAAQLTILVSDEHGPLRDAIVRLVPGPARSSW